MPKLYEKKDQGLDLEGDLEPEEYGKAIQKYKNDSFKRGAMMFDDYNYNQFNEYILYDDP